MNVTDACGRIHAAVEGLPVCTRPHHVPFDNGLYFFFEDGEKSRHGPKGRIVRVGRNKSSTLKRRLDQHFSPYKNSSVFRKYAGGALIRRDDPDSPCLAPEPGGGHWERQDEHTCPMCQPVEGAVSEYFEENTSFRCVRVDESDERSYFERVLIATIAQCPMCVASSTWLGRDAYSKKVQRTGLWNSQHTSGQTISHEEELRRFENLAAATVAPPSLAPLHRRRDHLEPLSITTEDRAALEAPGTAKLKITPEQHAALEARLRALGHEPRRSRGVPEMSSRYTILLNDQQVGELLQLRWPSGVPVWVAHDGHGPRVKGKTRVEAVARFLRAGGLVAEDVTDMWDAVSAVRYVRQRLEE